MASRDASPPGGTGRGRPRQENGPTIPTPPSSKIDTSVVEAADARTRTGCPCGHLEPEPCYYDTPAVDRYRARLGLPPLGVRNPGTCRCQRWTFDAGCICRWQEVA